MAGMLPGVECARRRRCHQNKAWSDSPAMTVQGWTRRPALCLYTSSYENLLTSNSSLQRSMLDEAPHDEKLDGIAREAKKRLDERFRAQGKSETRRGMDRMVTRKFSWAKLSRKDTGKEQDKCAQCW